MNESLWFIILISAVVSLIVFYLLPYCKDGRRGPQGDKGDKGAPGADGGPTACAGVTVTNTGVVAASGIIAFTRADVSVDQGNVLEAFVSIIDSTGDPIFAGTEDGAVMVTGTYNVVLIVTTDQGCTVIDAVTVTLP